MKHLDQLRLLFWTVRYLSGTQVWYRGRRIVRRRLWQLQRRTAPQPTAWQLARHKPLYIGLRDSAQNGPWQEEVASACQQADRIAVGQFCFLNQSVKFETHPGWNRPDLLQLWRYHLHYFGYVQELAVWTVSSKTSTGYETFRRLATSWIESNRALKGDGWHPYTLSLRLVNWLHAASAFEEQLNNDEPFRQLLLNSLYGQAQILASDLELDVRGNHLLENIRALLWLGIAFEGKEPQRWFDLGIQLLQQELSEQILSDGGHFERSPGYHILVLKDCLEIALWLRHNGKDSPAWLDDAIRRMLDYLVAILPLNQKVPLLKDTAWDAAPEPMEILAAGALYFDEPRYKKSKQFGLYPLLVFGYSGWQKFQSWSSIEHSESSSALSATNHYVMRDDTSGEYLIFDTGKPCPDYLPAHAHADLLSYELSLDQQRVVVDSGIYKYASGHWRNFFRSTRAHNTVEVNDVNQSEVWGSFRVARRARPSPTYWQEEDKFILAQATHDGYKRLPVNVIHRRTLAWQKGDFWLVADELWGKQAFTSANHVHLHPHLSLKPESDSTWCIEGADHPLWLTAFGGQRHSITQGQESPVRQGWYSEYFGQLQSNTVWTLHHSDVSSICYGYVISQRDPVQIKLDTSATSEQITITHGAQTHTLLLNGEGPPHFQ